MDLKLTQHLKLDFRMRCSVDEMTWFTSCQLRPAAELTTELRASQASEALSNSSRFLLSLLSNLKLHRALRRHPTLYTSFCAHAGALFKHNFDVKFLSNTKSERLIWMCTHPGLETCVWSRTWWRRCPRGWTWSLACRDKQEVKTCHLSPSRRFAGGDLYTQSKMLEQFLLF